jgi:hypothetical protein
VRFLRLAGAATGVLGALLVVAGCAANPVPAVTPTVPLASPSGQAAAPSATVTGPDATAAPVGPPTCEGIISSVTVDDLTKLGWEARQDPFYVGNIELAGGIQCTWGDPGVASDQVQVYGWAPMDDAVKAEVTKELLDSGWKEFDEDGATYLTATGHMIMNPDEDGYGITFRLGDGQISVADTKQGLQLVQWPPQ